jgi:hypothetical protein
VAEQVALHTELVVERDLRFDEQGLVGGQSAATEAARKD